MSQHKYTPEQRAFIRNNIKGTPIPELTRLFNVRFGTDLPYSAFKAYCSNHGLRNGVDCRFSPNSVPWNNGKKGYMGANRTSFKLGHSPKNYRPVGSERVNKDGYVEIKIRDPKTWRCKHLVIWEAEHGPLPRGFAVIFADGDRKNFALDNLLKVSRAELLYLNRNHLIQQDKDLTKVCANIAKLAVRASKRQRG